MECRNRLQSYNYTCERIKTNIFNISFPIQVNRIKKQSFSRLYRKSGRPNGAKQTQIYQSLQTVLLLWSIFKSQRDYLFVENIGKAVQQAPSGRPISKIKDT